MPDLRDKILQALSIKGRDFSWMYSNLLEEGGSESYLRNVLSELKRDNLIGRTMKTYWLMTDERRDNYEKVGRGEVANSTSLVVSDLWCQGILSNQETEMRNNLKYSFSTEDGEVFLTLASIILSRPRVVTKKLNQEDNWTEEMVDRWTVVMNAIRRWQNQNG